MDNQKLGTTVPMFANADEFVEQWGVVMFVGYFTLHRYNLTLIMKAKEIEVETGERIYTVDNELELNVWLDNAAPLLPIWAKVVLGENLTTEPD